MQTFKSMALFLVVGVTAYWLLPDRSSSRNASAESVQYVTYQCKETKQLVEAPPQSSPAVNPQTGRATLYRALYCEKCKTWQIVPPPDVFPGNPLTYRCPKHQSPMAAIGPRKSK